MVGYSFVTGSYRSSFLCLSMLFTVYISNLSSKRHTILSWLVNLFDNVVSLVPFVVMTRDLSLFVSLALSRVTKYAAP
jgi:hypothetical protein